MELLVKRCRLSQLFHIGFSEEFLGRPISCFNKGPAKILLPSKSATGLPSKNKNLAGFLQLSFIVT